jgi:2'-hydroxyisoflavone reductase
VTTQGAKFVWFDSNFVEKQELSPGVDLPVWIPRGPDSAGFATRSVAKAVAQGLTFRPLATTAADTLAFYNSLPAERTAALRAGLKPEREAELLQAWRQK